MASAQGRSEGPPDPLAPYVPRITAEWDLESPGAAHRRVEGTLCFVDISGFTALSEKLARKGRIGAEQLTEILDSAFGAMLSLAYERGGSLLKFGGDALLLMFESSDHPIQACSAAVEMRTALARSPGKLRMSIGIHTGAIDLFRVGRLHRELIVTGPVASDTARLESAASAGEILVSPAVREALPKGSANSPKAPGYLLKWRSPRLQGHGIVPRRRLPPEAVELSLDAVLRSHLSQSKVESEHRFAISGFVSFSGFDSLVERDAAGAAVSALDALISGIQEAAATEEVTFLASDIYVDGGKVLLTTGVPHTKEDDEGRMLRTLRKIADIETPLAVRIGVNRGHVFSGDVGTSFRRTYTIEGDAVNLAARLMAAAPPGQIYTDPEVLSRSRTLFETTPVPPFTVKGKTAPVHAFALGQETGTRSVDARRGLPFVGRVEELAMIRAALKRREDGIGGVVTVTGEAGIGKSRLVVEAIGDPFASLMVRGEPNATTNPYRAFRDPLRRALGIERSDQAAMRRTLDARVGELAPTLAWALPLIGDVAHIEMPETEETRLIEPQFRPSRTVDAMLALFEALFPDGLVAIAEDAHWFDDRSSGVFERIAAVAPDRPCLVVVTRRPVDQGLRPKVGVSIDLQPLTDDEARRAVIDATVATPLRPDEVEALANRSGGNPMFLEELVRRVMESGGLDELPESLDAMVGAQIDSLAPLPRRLLRYSSVLGQSFRQVVLEGLLRDEELEVDAATRRALARFIDVDDEGRLRFRHAVARDAAYRSLTYKKRRELHERAGAVIEELAGRDADEVAAALGTHFFLAGLFDKAWHYSRIAGDRARDTYASVEAAAHYERALSALRKVDEDDPLSRAEVLTSLGDVLELAGRFDQSLWAFRAASRLMTGDVVVLADLHLRCARVLVRAGRYRQALGETTKGIRVLEGERSLSSLRSRARLTSYAAVVRMSQERPKPARKLAEQAVDTAEKTDAPEALARAYLVLDWTDWAMGAPDAGGRGLDALAIYRRLGQPDQAGNILNNLGAYAYFDGRWDEAVGWYEQGRDAFHKSGNEVAAAVAGTNIAEVLIGQGRWREAEPMLVDALHVLRGSEAQDDALFAEILNARLLIAKGDRTSAIDTLAKLRRVAGQQGRGVTGLEVAVCLADAVCRDGDPREALHILEEAETGAGGQAVAIAASTAVVRAEALGALGSVGEALEEIGEGLLAAEEQALAFQEYQLRVLRVSIDGGREPDGVRIHALADQLGIVS